MASIFTRRIIAYVLDFFVVSAVMWILSYLLYYMFTPGSVYVVYQYLPYVVPILILIYFVFLEKQIGSTVGKSLMHLEVRSRNGAQISWIQAIVRNLTKIYWIPIIFDWLIGKLLHVDRFLSSITKTVVVEEY